MDNRQCPGADNLKIPELKIVKCPYCGGEVEFFSREVKSKCSECGKVVFREEKPSCIDWCPMAEVCFGKKDLKGK